MVKRKKKGGAKMDSRHRRAGGRSSEIERLPEYEGKVQMTREGFVFVNVEGLEGDIYVKQGKTRGALNADTVKVAVTRKAPAKGRTEGVITQIVQRSTKPFVGVFHMVGKQAWVLMQSKTMPYDIAVDIFQAKELGARQGMKVAVLVDGWDRGESEPHGHVVDVLGMPGENDTEMHAILAEYCLPYKFDPEVEKAADQISDKIRPADRKGRKDFRKTLTFTIDPADAKDFDDALSLRKLPNGNYEVGVHIADVSYYVTPGSEVDKEAMARGTSVYLVDRTVPMLPEKLCNKLCSLRPGEEKLTFSAVFEITPLARIVGSWFGRTEIISDWRFDYDGAQKIIEDPASVSDVPEPLKEAILTLNNLAAKLRKKRFAAGAISFDRPEMKVEVDEKGRPVNVYQKVSKEANWLIEEFMLLANRSVAEFIATDGKMNGTPKKNARTFIYRIHDEPNGEKLCGLRDFAGTFGYQLEATGTGRETAKALNAMLASAKDKPEFAALETLALRSMAKAKYSTDNIGHYGLAFKFYTHFTSPIRRYPDTMVHRLLAMYLDGAKSQDKAWYEEQCMHASERETIAAEAERASIKYKLVEFMQDKVGNVYEGHISGLTEWGMYVEIEPTKVEGMVALREIKSDFFEFDENSYCLYGRRSRKVFHLGDPVKISVKGTNLEQKLLDYELIEGEMEMPEKRPSGGSRSRKGSSTRPGRSTRRKK